MNAMPNIQDFCADNTVLPPCRAHDHVAWIRGTGLFGDATDGATILDFWECRAGDVIVLTNRFDDLPTWFTLSTTEARGHAARALLPLVRAGDASDTPAIGPNIWRVMAGDKIAWLGSSRSGHESHDGVLAIFDFAAPTLAAGQPARGDMEDWQFFGAPSGDTPDPDAVAAVRRALEVVRGLGMPGTVRIDGWAIG